MNVTVENKDGLNALMTVEIKPQDYNEKVEKVLKDYRRKANIPGFRPGHVPQSLIRKQYGKAVLIEEVNHLLQHAVYDHLRDQKLDILGNPLPVAQNDIDWDNQQEFSFEFELGLSPELKLNFDDKTKVTYYHIVADKKMIDRYVEDYSKRYGKMQQPQDVTDKAIVKALVKELSADGSTPIEGGISGEIRFDIKELKEKKARKEIIGKKIGDRIVIKPADTFSDKFRLDNQLGVSQDDINDSTGVFELDIIEINEIEPAPLDQELFDKVFGEGTVKSEKEFREKIKSDAEEMFVGESDRKFYEDVKDTILAKMDFKLPEEFLKKWMRTAGEKPVSEEEVEKQFPDLKNSMKWQLVENKVVNEYNIEVEESEIVNYTKEMVGKQMAQYGQVPDEEQLNSIAERVLENKDEAQRIMDQLFTTKLIKFFKENLKLVKKEVTVDEFVKLIQKK